MFKSLYQLQCRLQHQSKPFTTVQAGFKRLLANLGLRVILCCSLCCSYSGLTHSDEKNISSPFYALYQQRKKTTKVNTNRLLTMVMPHQYHSITPTSNPSHEGDLAFNYLWLQQHQTDYSHKKGGGAASKLLRMGIVALYKNRYGGEIKLSNGEDIGLQASSFDYRLRMSDSKVKLGIEYDF